MLWVHQQVRCCQGGPILCALVSVAGIGISVLRSSPPRVAGKMCLSKGHHHQESEAMVPSTSSPHHSPAIIADKVFCMHTGLSPEISYMLPRGCKVPLGWKGIVLAWNALYNIGKRMVVADLKVLWGWILQLYLLIMLSKTEVFPNLHATSLTQHGFCSHFQIQKNKDNASDNPMYCSIYLDSNVDKSDRLTSLGSVIGVAGKPGMLNAQGLRFKNRRFTSLVSYDYYRS